MLHEYLFQYAHFTLKIFEQNVSIDIDNIIIKVKTRVSGGFCPE